MDFTLSHEQRLLVETVRDFIATELAPLEETVEAEGALASATARAIFEKSRALGLYGMNIESALHDYSDAGRDAAGQAWLAGSEWAIDAQGMAHRDRAALEAQLHKSDAFAHVQDLLESDILLASDYASHEGGFAAAMAHLGAAEPAMYHIDHTRAGTPRARTIPEEIARVVRARAANPEMDGGRYPPDALRTSP